MTFFLIPETDEELLAECEVETYCSSGKGGQNVNKRETAVRLRHLPSGIVVTCQDERSQFRNKQIGLEILRDRLKKRNHRQKPRIATKIPRSVKETVLKTKKIISAKKNLRRRVNIHED